MSESRREVGESETELVVTKRHVAAPAPLSVASGGWPCCASRRVEVAPATSTMLSPR